MKTTVLQRALNDSIRKRGLLEREKNHLFSFAADSLVLKKNRENDDEEDDDGDGDDVDGCTQTATARALHYAT